MVYVTSSLNRMLKFIKIHVVQISEDPWVEPIMKFQLSTDAFGNLVHEERLTKVFLSPRWCAYHICNLNDTSPTKASWEISSIVHVYWRYLQISYRFTRTDIGISSLMWGNKYDSGLVIFWSRRFIVLFDSSIATDRASTQTLDKKVNDILQDYKVLTTAIDYQWYLIC